MDEVTYLKSIDPIMSNLIDQFGHVTLAKKGGDFSSLVEIIVSQQLSTKASKTIYNRWIELFRSKEITAMNALAIPVMEVQSIGLSAAKTSYIAQLAELLVNNPDFLTDLNNFDDMVIFKSLTNIKGVGPWTAYIFMMFNLGKENIFPEGDVSLQKAIRELYQLNPDEYGDLIKTWTPYCSTACLYLWRWVDQC
jgi:DNA-3-methyladenine glycosylase II